jgi:FKBP-type peptidyl-prolyl cis-trans isomerase SlyD
MSTTNLVHVVHYQLFRDTAEGELIESTEGGNPLAFISGIQQMIPTFEEEVKDLKAGAEFAFGIPSDKAYGPRHDDAIMDLPKDIFMKDGKMAEEVAPGNMVPLQDQNGQVVPAIVLGIDEKTVKVDVNHPLAGQDLFFKGTVVETRPATQEELDHGHVHGEHGHQH